jgi:hypothetical protein
MPVRLAVLALGASLAPDPGGAALALVDSALRVTGDLCGSAGLLAGSGVALAGDVLALIDHNRATAPWLAGFASRPTLRAAMALSWGGTSLLEALRGEDIERLPEAPATYLEAAPGIGRVDTALSAAGALWLATYDAATAPALVGLRLAGARERAARLDRARTEMRVRMLGPEPLP